jgi:hypothetical protein
MGATEQNDRVMNSAKIDNEICAACAHQSPLIDVEELGGIIIHNDDDDDQNIELACVHH